MNLVKILLFFLIVSSASANFYSSYQLKKSDVYLGIAYQNDGVAYETFEVIRNKNTPFKVNLLFKYEKEEQVCVEFKTEVTIVPGHYEFKCEIVDNEEVCSDVWIPEEVKTHKKCIRYEDQIKVTFKKIILDFKSAAKLYGDVSEKFKISLKQQKLSSGKFDIEGSVINADNRYEIFPRSFLHKYQTLYFSKR